METPLVSFCFTTYKRDQFLKETLESVKKQSYNNYEVIVSDNDPEEMGRAVVASMNDSRFKYFPNGENLGMKKSFNKSLERSTGEFIVMIADDDPVYDDMLQTLVDLMNEFPGYGMYLGGADWFCSNPQVAQLYNLKVGTNSLLNNNVEVGHKNCYSSDEYLSGFYSFTIFPAYLWSTGMVRRKALVDMGGVPDYGTPFLGDYAYLPLMGAHSGTVTINKALGRQTVHSQNFGRNQNEQLVKAVTGYTAYLEARLKHLASWSIAKEKMYRFVGHWVLSHLAFLYQYNKKNGINDPGLAAAEEQVFNVDFMKKYKIKYFLKKNYPSVHNTLVKLKSSMP
jgi:glycosyltransferase involved in cell wall biosynthesis